MGSARGCCSQEGSFRFALMHGFRNDLLRASAATVGKAPKEATPNIQSWVKIARAQLKPGDLRRKVKIYGEPVNVDGMYLRIICHDNEHMGQLIAYARMNGIVPPWSAGVVLPK
jgi:hypothetical protein